MRDDGRNRRALHVDRASTDDPGQILESLQERKVIGGYISAAGLILTFVFGLMSARPAPTRRGLFVLFAVGAFWVQVVGIGMSIGGV